MAIQLISITTQVCVETEGDFVRDLLIAAINTGIEVAAERGALHGAEDATSRLVSWSTMFEKPLAERLHAVISEANEAGYAATAWSPQEVRGVDVDDLLDRVVSCGNDFIGEKGQELIEELLDEVLERGATYEQGEPPSILVTLRLDSGFSVPVRLVEPPAGWSAVEDDAKHILECVLATAKRHAAPKNTVFCRPRNKDGWLEWALLIEHGEDTNPLMISHIQRDLFAPVEKCS